MYCSTKGFFLSLIDSRSKLTIRLSSRNDFRICNFDSKSLPEYHMILEIALRINSDELKFDKMLCLRACV